MKTTLASHNSSAWGFLEALDNPVPADVVGTLAELGVNVVRECEKESGAEVLAHCPMHQARTGKEDRHPSFWVNATTGCFICFSCQYQGAFSQLVCDALDLTHAEAGRWIVTRRRGQGRKRREIVHRVEKYVVSEPEYARLPEPPLDELKARGLTRIAAQAYGVRWRDGAWILPIRNQWGDLMGWQEKRGHTFFNRPDEVKKSMSLFGWSRFTPGSVAILVESPLDAVRIGSIGIHGALASFGASVSDVQMRLIKQRASSLILALDNPFVDRAGREAADQLYRRWTAFGMPIKIFNYRDMKGKDPGELTRQEIERGIETACTPRGLGRVCR